MAVTIKQIATLSNVSTGTVDRVLNGRGRVAPETAAQVRRVAEQLGYRPNRAGRALAAARKPYIIGVLLTSEGNPFFDEVIRGVRAAESELSDYGASVRLCGIKGYDSAVQCTAMEELCEGIHGLILNPIDDPAVARKIDELSARGVPVLTMNTDIGETSRLCYVGSDYEASGATACGMLGLMLPPDAEIGILTGSVKVLGHNQRLAGFRRVMRDKYPGFRVADVLETNDDDFIAFEAAKFLLAAHSGLDGIFVAAAGTYGVCRALLSLGLEQRICTICMDTVPATQDMLRQGVLRATISQQPFMQGYQSVQRMFGYLMAGEQPEDYIVKNEIRIAENI